MTNPKTITIDETKYIRADSAPEPVTGDRKIVVLDRGWIMVGNVDVRYDSDGCADGYIIRNCANIRKWATGGFGGLTKSSKDSGAVLDPCGDVIYTECILEVPVPSDW